MHQRESGWIKRAHRTELCIYTLREYIELYRKRSTTVFVGCSGKN